VFELWRSIHALPAARAHAALRLLLAWLADAVEADNVIWIGAVRVLAGRPAQRDPFAGWRLRERQTLRPDSPAYRKRLDDYLARDHYGKLTPTYYTRSHTEKEDAHVGMAVRALLAGAGTARVHRLRDGWIDYARFRRTAHYELYYRGVGITDRIWISFPVDARRESVFLIDRHRRPRAARRRNFSAADAALAATAVFGAGVLHRWLFLSSGLLAGDKPLSPVEHRVLSGLLTGHSEKEIAAATGHNPATLHKYVVALYARYGVNSRAALMARWLGDGGTV
jgi:DNA-binding CsgD family transcriptional regulator